jgi:hypothetical protein
MFYRFIIYCILAYVAFRFVRRLMSPRSRQRSSAGTRRATSAQMIRCENCGMFITESSAILVNGRDFCSSACAHRNDRI